jgi:hypothetical protein
MAKGKQQRGNNGKAVAARPAVAKGSSSSRQRLVGGAGVVCSACLCTSRMCVSCDFFVELEIAMLARAIGKVAVI